MFTELGRFVVHNPWKVIAAWVIAAVAVVAFAPTLADVTNKDQASFLPDSYESVQAQELAAGRLRPDQRRDRDHRGQAHRRAAN